MVDLLITLHPDSVRYYQKRVEISYRTGDRNRLLDAYLDLGDALLRMQADDKAPRCMARAGARPGQPERRSAAGCSMRLPSVSRRATSSRNSTSSPGTPGSATGFRAADDQRSSLTP